MRRSLARTSLESCGSRHQGNELGSLRVSRPRHSSRTPPVRTPGTLAALKGPTVMRTILPLACILLASAALPACSSSKPDAQSAAAATAAPLTAAAPADAAVASSPPAAASGDATAGDATAAAVASDCPLIGSDAVAKVMHLEVKSVEMKS